MASSLTSALREADHRKAEKIFDRNAAKLGKLLQGHIRVIQPDNDPRLKAVNEALTKQRHRKVN